MAPTYPDRDYCYGLTLVSTGMRRAEGAALLDVQLLSPHAFPPGGVIEFVITGKRKVSSRLRHVSSRGLYEGLL